MDAINGINCHRYFGRSVLKKILFIIISSVFCFSQFAVAKDFYFCSPSWTNVGSAESSQEDIANSKIMVSVFNGSADTLTLLGGIAREEAESGALELSLGDFSSVEVDEFGDVEKYLINGVFHHTNNYQIQINGGDSLLVEEGIQNFGLHFASNYEDGTLQWDQSYVCR